MTQKIDNYKQRIYNINMPRISRNIIFSESKYCHVLVQGIAKEYLFDSDKLKSFYLKCLSEKKSEFDISILAFCVMGNHAHLILTANKMESISLYLKKVNTTYAKYYNKKNKRVGFVFRNRFRAEAIRNETYLLNCISYVHNNPVKAKIVTIAEDYGFSSAKNYATEQGIVDFNKLKEIYGNIPKDVPTSEEFIDDRPNNSDNAEEILNSIIKKHQIASKNNLQEDFYLLGKVVEELKEETRMSLREIAELLELSREKVRRSVSSFTSQ